MHAENQVEFGVFLKQGEQPWLVYLNASGHLKIVFLIHQRISKPLWLFTLLSSLSSPLCLDNCSRLIARAYANNTCSLLKATRPDPYKSLRNVIFVLLKPLVILRLLQRELCF